MMTTKPVEVCYPGQKRVEVQMAQTAVLNTITELRQFNMVKITRNPKEGNTRGSLDLTSQQ